MGQLQEYTKQHRIKILTFCTKILCSYIFIFQIMEHHITDWGLGKRENEPQIKMSS